MGKKHKKRRTSIPKIKLFLALIVFGSITGALGYNCLNNVLKIKEMKQEKNALNEQIVSLKEKKEILETDILKLKDPDYIARYVREKYFYSKDGELILRIDD